MKRLFVVLAILLVSQFALAGVEFLGVDGVETSFVANTGELSMSGDSLVIIVDYEGVAPQSSINPGTFSLNTTLVSGAHFEGGTFEFTDTSSVLLSGDIVAIDFAESFGLLTGSGTALVLVENLDGNLLGDSQIVSLTFNISPSVGQFGSDFTGLSKVNFIVPEPATIGLLALGATIFIRKRKK